MKLAELNVGYAKYPLDDPRMAGFMDNLDRHDLQPFSLGGCPVTWKYRF